MMNIAEEFFAMPLEDKALYFSEDPKKFPRLGTSQGRHKEKVRYWRDFLNLRVYPLEKYVHLFPEKPSNFRNILAKYTLEAKDLATRISKLISIGLGLNKDYFEGNLSGSDSFMSINYYPPCPNPKLTFGLPKHCDANLITLLLQVNISGLQILHDGEWLGADPIPNAFVVNFGLLMEVITNGLLKAVEHRAVTNLNVARTSIFLSTNPTDDCIISPAQALVSEDHNPPRYKPFNPREFLNVFYSKEGDKMAIMEAFTLEN